VTRVISCSLLLLLAGAAQAQDRLPVLDMHLHALPADWAGPPPLATCQAFFPFLLPWDPAESYQDRFVAMHREPPCDDPVWSPMTDEDIMAQTIEIMERRNVFGVLSGTPDRVADWMAAAPGRFLPAFFPEIGSDGASVDTLRALHARGRLAALAEVGIQYDGITPADDRMEPYWALAEELDIPVGIHIGPGPPGAIHLGNPGYRARLHSPLILEEVLVRHPGLRVYIMHAAWPMLDDLLAVLWAHPQVHVDVAVINWVIPREEFHRYLERIVGAGFGTRVLFGSDQMIWPGIMEIAIESIESADFLSAEQKRNILYNNAARFLRLSKEEIALHHGR
jgi:uncharacterized protein